MTWVCAASTIFGYGALYSDVQVTLANGNTKDLIQKTYPLGDSVAAGFAGSVKIGFTLLQSLSDFLNLEDSQRIAWDPRCSNWVPIARSIFNSSADVERALGSEILAVMASPNEPCGLGAKIYFTRFASPDFRPGLMSRAIKLCSIGTGAGVNIYKHHLKQHFRAAAGIHRAEGAKPGGWAEEICSSISRALSNHPRTGISRHVHMLIIRRGSIRVGTNNENIYPSDGPRIEIRMPAVARGYQEFQAMAASSGYDAAGAIC